MVIKLGLQLPLLKITYDMCLKNRALRRIFGKVEETSEGG
jgi:hypothetical protein